jgi:hypothetical protein
MKKILSWTLLKLRTFAFEKTYTQTKLGENNCKSYILMKDWYQEYMRNF